MYDSLLLFYKYLIFRYFFNKYSYVIAAGTLTLNSIAHDGVSSTVSGAGNAITSVTLTDGKCLSFTTGNFAEAYKGDKSCVNYASKADSLKVSAAVGSATQGVYFKADGTPVAMTNTLEKSITTDTCLFKGLGTGLKVSGSSLCINYATSVTSNSDLPVTAKQVKAYIDAKLVDLL